MRHSLHITILMLPFAALTGGAHAHGGVEHGKPAVVVKEQKPWGIAGDAARVNRTITIRMSDDMRFRPDKIRAGLGDTVRFVLKNDGRMLHEMVIGTKAELEKHAAMMRKFPEMEHDEPYMAHVAPGKSGEIVWQFNRAGVFDFACLIPGHYEAGMVGSIEVGP